MCLYGFPERVFLKNVCLSLSLSLALSIYILSEYFFENECLSLELGSRTFAHLEALVQLGHHLLYIYGSEVVYYERNGNILSNVRVPPIHVCIYVCMYVCMYVCTYMLRPN